MARVIPWVVEAEPKQSPENAETPTIMTLVLVQASSARRVASPTGALLGETLSSKRDTGANLLIFNNIPIPS